MGEENNELGDLFGGQAGAQVTAYTQQAAQAGSSQSEELRRIVENSCMSCNRTMKTSEIKILPPRYIQDRDEYVKSGVVGKRLMCVQCYNALKNVTKTRVRYRDTPTSRRSYLLRSVINNLLLKS